MAGETWGLTSKTCDGSKTATAAAFSRRDAACLCADKLASRRARVILCDVCERAPASVTCKADAAALCASCDRDIHSVNALARRHERLPVIPFSDAFVIGDEFSEEAEVEAASWLLNDDSSGQLEYGSGSPEYESTEYLISKLDPCLDLDLISYEQKPNKINGVMTMNENSCSDGVVPVHIHCKNEFGTGQVPGRVDGLFPSCEVNYPGSKPFMYNFTTQSICPSVSSSSLDVGLVPDHNPTAEATDAFVVTDAEPFHVQSGEPVSGLDREARVSRYREKRKNRKFEKTIRYASRKAYAETRPRIRGRFVKHSELELDSSYLVVPTFL